MIPVVYKGIKKGYQDSAALAAAAPGGYYTLQAPKINLDSPYIVGAVQSNAEVDSFGGDGFRGLFAFNIYAPRYSSGAAVSIADATLDIILELRSAYHNQINQVVVDGVTWNVHTKAAYGIAIPERDDLWHHVETYSVTCFPVT